MVNVLILIPFLFFVVPPSVGFFENPPQDNFPKAQSPWNIRLTRFLLEVQWKDNDIFVDIFIFVFFVFYLHDDGVLWCAASEN